MKVDADAAGKVCAFLFSEGDMYFSGLGQLRTRMDQESRTNRADGDVYYEVVKKKSRLFITFSVVFASEKKKKKKEPV